MGTRVVEHPPLGGDQRLVTIEDIRAARDKLTGHPATIFMPVNAPLPKVEATRNYGATVELGGQAVDDCIASAKDLCQDGEAVFVPPFDDPLIVAGQGTIG